MSSGKINSFLKRIPFLWRVTLSYVSLSMIVFICFGNIAYFYVRSFQEESLERNLEEEGQRIEELFTMNKLVASDFVYSDYQICVYNFQDEMVFANSILIPDIPYKESQKGFQGYGNISRFRHQILDESDSFFAGLKSSSIEVAYYNKIIYDYEGQQFYFQIAKNLQEYKAFLEGVTVAMVMIIFTGVLISFIVGYFVTRRSLFAVKKITDTAEKISFENISGRLEPIGTNDEFDNLITTLNKMIDRLHHSISHQKQFVSDASHELKTPIAVMEGYTNLIRRWGYRDEKIFDESVDIMLKEIKTMRTIIENLLFLARVETQSNQKIESKVTLGALLADLQDELDVVYPDRKIKYSWSGDAEVYGNYDLLLTLLRIFCENAVKYTAPDSVIEVEVRHNDNPELLIIDHGAGIAEEHKEKIFNRFYRIDESRNRKIGGSGLGLSIAKRVVELHNGEIFVENTPGGGATFRIVFPVIESGE